MLRDRKPCTGCSDIFLTCKRPTVCTVQVIYNKLLDDVGILTVCCKGRGDIRMPVPTKGARSSFVMFLVQQF
jgi:hypothetical protein